VLAATQRAIAEGLPRPAAIVAGTAWSDLSETGDSYATNRHLDAWNYPDILGEMARQYAPRRDRRDPRLSPVYGSFADFPPTLLLSGTRDIFLSHTVRVDRKLRDAGRQSALIVYEGQSHAAYLGDPDLPETQT
jgi:monoterpene epsilon-lactone hydrolase